MFYIRRYDQCPPGEFWYQQTDGLSKIFRSNPDIYGLAKRVCDFRRGNNLSRDTIQEALEDIDAFTCQRLHNSISWCYESNRSFGELHPAPASSGCGTCGARV